MSEIRIKKGFTLVELLIVMLVIGIVASISTVGALSTKLNANESVTKSALKAIVSSAESFSTANGRYPTSLAELGPEYLASDVVSGQKSGYEFALISANSGYTFTVTANPISRNNTGINSFCITANNAIWVYDTGVNIVADGQSCPAGGDYLS